MASSRPTKISILLVSKTGNGKSSLANALLNTSEFQVGRGMLSGTAHCKCVSTFARGRNLTVVDTPGTMDVTDEEKAKTEIRRAIEFCPEGFDVFMVVVKCDTRFTAEERRAIEVVAEMFGDEFYRHAIVVFSHGDDYDNDETTFKRDLLEIRRGVPYLNQLLNRCGDRFVLVDNSRRCERTVQGQQIENLLCMADRLVASNGGRKYTSVELEAERKRAEEQERREQERRREEMEREAAENRLRLRSQYQEMEERQMLTNAFNTVLQLGAALAAAALAPDETQRPRRTQITFGFPPTPNASWCPPPNPDDTDSD